jgi:hypothetical protein
MLFRLRFVALAMAMFGPLAIADEKPIVSPLPPVVTPDKPNQAGPILPDAPSENVAPTPRPPIPGAAISVKGERMYSVRWNVPFDVECFPDSSLINIEDVVLDDKAGEKLLRVFGRFVDGEQQVMWRKFSEKYVKIITAKEGAVGQVDCLFVVDGQKAPRKRVTLSINGGVTPTPVPPGPGPTPTPPVDPPVVKNAIYRMVVVKNVGEWTPQQNAVMNNAALAAWMKEKGHRWREASINAEDKDGNPPKDLKPLLDLAKTKKLPQVFLVDQNGVLRHSFDFPSSGNAATEIREVVEKFGG